MRPEKDPFRTAMAVRSLPRASRIQVVHIGAAFGYSFLRRAEREAERNPRYRWLGDLPHWKTRQLLANSHLTSITSRMEGSSNVLCEALASGVPVGSVQNLRTDGHPWATTIQAITSWETPPASGACCSGPRTTQRFTRVWPDTAPRSRR